MEIKDIHKKIEHFTKELCETPEIEKLDESLLALISLLTRFVIEKENIQKSHYHWNVLHTFLHFESTQNSNLSILKSIIFYLSHSTKEFDNVIQMLGNYIKEYKDDYWEWTSSKIIKKDFIFHSESSKMENPIDKIWGAKIYASKAKNSMFIYSKERIKKFKVYKCQLEQYKNPLGHNRYFATNIEDISQYKEPIDRKFENSKYINAFFSRYPMNHRFFKNIAAIKSNKFYYIKQDQLISSVPHKDISFIQKFDLIDDAEKDAEKRKCELHQTLSNGKLPFVKGLEIKPTDTKGTKHSLVSFGEFTTNNATHKLTKILVNIFNTFKKTESPYFFGSYIDKTLTIRPAGHGKSSAVVEYIIDNPNERFSIFTPTRKASEVFHEVGKQKNVNIITTQKLMANFNYYRNTEDLITNRILFFDEISMYEADWWEKNSWLQNYKQINFLGDPWQIPPIYEEAFLHVLSEISNNRILTNDSHLTINHRLKKTSHDYEKIKMLLRHIREGRINVRNGIYKDLFISYDGYREAFSILDKEEYSNYTIITAINNGVLSVNNINRIKVRGDFEVGDHVVWNDKSTNNFYPGKKLKIIKIEKFVNVIEYYFEGIDEPYTKPDEENYSFDFLKTLSGHRSQGQTIKNVFVILTDDNDLVDIRWLYTAASRVEQNIRILYPIDFNFDKLYKNQGLNQVEKQQLKIFIKNIEEKI